MNTPDPLQTLCMPLLAIAEEYCRDELDHRHLHTATDMARLLMQRETADPRIVLPAIIFHDAGWHLYDHDAELQVRGPRASAAHLVRGHEQESARLVQEHLPALGYTPAEVREIAQIVDGHDSRLHALSQNDKVVKDADKLARYTADGIATFTEKFGMPEHEFLQFLERGLGHWFFTDAARVHAQLYLACRRHLPAEYRYRESIAEHLLTHLANMELDMLTNVRREMESLAIQQVRGLLRAAAKQVELYLAGRRQIDIAALQADAAFEAIAVQPLGETGYTAIIDRRRQCPLFHIDKRVINLGLEEFKRERPPELTPGFFEWYERVLRGEECHAYYLSKDVHDQVRQKFQYSFPLDIADQQWAMVAVAFLDEFRRPLDLISGEISRSLTRMANTLEVQLLKPFQYLVAGTERIAQGDLDFRIHMNRHDEIGFLSDKFDNMSERLLIARETTQQIEDEIRELNSQLEEKVNLRTAELEAAIRELEAFSYSVSHDLRAPLRHLHAHAHLLREAISDQDADAISRHLGAIDDASRLMGHLVDDLLRFARMGRSAMQWQSVDVQKQLREVIDSLDADTRGRDIEWSFDSLPEVIADSALLRQVWLNLIGNAIKYTRGRTPALIRIEAAEQSPGHWQFSISDNGVGFDMAYADKLFNVFQRLHNSREFEGTGVGLAIVRRIIERHGGQVSIHSQAGIGTTVRFTLPRVPVTAQH